ncbi:MAG: hydantoinase/oxoprolinase family protein [Nitrososphaerota archaeon]|nr:hydantoinase/oxoprolinase family protein [Nitrososphaerota archaeon]
MRKRIGVDIGGTFTDAILVDLDTGSTKTAKVPTTPSDPSVGFMNSVLRVLDDGTAQDVIQTVHATTIATNAIIEGNVAKGGFVTTEGFRDILEIQRQIRPKLYDIFFNKPKPLIPRHRAYEVKERVTAEGDVLTPLDEKSARSVALALKKAEVEAVAICLLHSYVNPDHERRLASIISEHCPGVFITVSSEISPQFREYVRASTTVINAVIMPVVFRYLAKLESQLSTRKVAGELYVMQSSGGLMTSAVAKEKPAYLIESGPAAGAIAASYIGKMLGEHNVISFDMGGTTAKASSIERGQPRMARSYEVGPAATPETGLTKGGGYPLKTPVIDLVEIGAGGGSIAWIDSGGALKVGPRSAGASPGPACYMTGGTEPTITDANLVLGRIDPSYFLGGEMKLNPEAASNAIKEKCATPLGYTIVESAMGIVDIANASMLRALSLVSVERGYDPREFSLVAFGGAGPMHVNALAKELGIPKVIIPHNPGLTSALGLLVTDVKHEFVQTYVHQTSTIDIDRLNKIYEDFRNNAMKLLSSEGVRDEDVSFVRSLDMRYLGQSYELLVEIPDGEVKPTDIRKIEERFFAIHERTYGHAVRTEPTQVVSVRLVGIGSIPKPRINALPRGNESPIDASKGTRNVYFSEASSYLSAGVFERTSLKWGNVVKGPAVIEDKDATTIVHPGYRVEVEKYGYLVMTPSH